MAKITYTPTTGSYMQPAWAAEPIGPQNMIPGGALLDPAQFTADATTGKRFVPAGTLIGRTYAERDAGTPFGAWASGDEEVYLLAFDTPDADNNPECELLKHHTLLRDHLLPGWDALPAANKATIRTYYYTQRAPFNV